MPVAARRLAGNRADETGRNLLRLALVMDPESKDALLIEAKLKAGLLIESSAPADVETRFAEQIRGAARQATPGFYALLLHRVVAMLEPENEAALLALAKAEKNGVDTGFEPLLDAAEGEWTKIVKSRTFDISVKEPWPFHIKVKKGDRLRITAKGTWRVLPRGRPRDPGDSQFYLQGRLGEGAPFRVGREYTLAVPDDTTLFLGMKENGAYGNNSGTITVTLQKLE